MRGLTLSDPAYTGVTAGFSPLSLSPALWLDASDTSTITASSGLVSEWRDKSGNSRHVTQSTATAQPTTGSATQNGRNVISFDGGDILKKSSSAITGDLTIVSVFKVATATAYVMPGISLAATNLARPVDRWHGSAAGNNLFIVDYGSAGTAGTDLRNWTTYKAWSCTYSSTTSTTPRVVEYENNVQKVALNSTLPNNTAAQAVCVGQREDGATTLNGLVAEIIIFPSILSSTDRAKVQTYLAAKWGL